MEIKTITYKERGSRSLEIDININGECVKLTAMGRSTQATLDFTLIETIRRFLKMIGFSDFSGLRNQQILSLIKQAVQF